MGIAIIILTVVHVIVCLMMVGSVLMQLPRSEGLGAAFGGGMTENVFGAQTTHVLAKLTVWLGIAFFVITLLLAMANAHNQPTGEALDRELKASGTEIEAPAEKAIVEEASVTEAREEAGEGAVSESELMQFEAVTPEIESPTMSLDAVPGAPGAPGLGISLEGGAEGSLTLQPDATPAPLFETTEDAPTNP